MRLRIKTVASMLAATLFFTILPNIQTVKAVGTDDVMTATNAFLDAYWDANKKYFYCNSDHQINPSHNPGPLNGLYADYWWEAQLWETVMDVYERTGLPKYQSMIDDVYDGFVSAYPSWEENPFNDDIGWWALASLRAYNLTGQSRYLTMSKQMFDHVYETQYSDDYGGGIWWNSIEFLTQKNVATNATAAIIAMKLYHALNDSTYLEKAEQLFAWVRNTFYDEDTGFVGDHISGDDPGVVSKWEYTYNFGQYAAAAYEMYLEKREEKYLEEAYKAIDWVINRMTNDGILIYEGDDDCPAFKMIFSRTVARIGSEQGKTEYIQFLQRNANQAFNHARSDGLIGADYSTTPDESAIQVIAAAAGVSILNLTEPDGNTGNIVSGNVFEAENARRYGIDNENTNSGFTGRGYTAGWNTAGTKIVFEYNAPTDGLYTLTFRYTAAAGDATRTILINGKAVNEFIHFAATSDWSEWSDSSIGVHLKKGRNTIELALQSGNGNYLNLDNLTIKANYESRIEAEDGLLNGVTTENIHEGFTGRGYIAGWNNSNTSVTVNYAAPESGLYSLRFHYSAAAGDATRSIIVNGDRIQYTTEFIGTSSWDEWRTVEILVPFSAGDNQIEIVQTAIDENYVNLDCLIIQRPNTIVAEAENGVLNSLTVENTHSGYSGTGYVAGWNKDGQSVDIEVMIPDSNYYTIVFRYSVGNGEAVRKLLVNGSPVQNELRFRGEENWNDYYTTEIKNIWLDQGTNIISLVYDSTLNSTNWLNLDCIIISYE